jgi:hypothetical protein
VCHKRLRRFLQTASFDMVEQPGQNKHLIGANWKRQGKYSTHWLAINLRKGPNQSMELMASQAQIRSKE